MKGMVDLIRDIIAVRVHSETHDDPIFLQTMSRAGKFIPGGGSKSTPRPGSGPIRAPEALPPNPDGSPAPDGKKRPFAKGSLVKPVNKNQRLPIAIMSAIVCCVLVSAGWYFVGYLPAQRQNAAFQQAILDLQKKEQDRLAAEAKAKAEALKLSETQRCTLTVDSTPTGATVTIGDFRKKTPATFTDIVPGTVTVVIRAEGYEDYHQDVAVTVDAPTDLHTIALTPMTGTVSLSSPQSDVTYRITGPDNFAHEGQLPDKLEKLPIGDYSVTATQKDWSLPTVNFSVHDHETVQREIKFPYANVSLTSVPSGATVRQGRVVLGQTPLNLSQIRPGDMHLSLDLAPYTLQRLDLHVPEFGNVIKQVTLTKDKDFIAGCGMPMVWIQDGGFWAGKYEVRQNDFETVTGYNPSYFHKPSRPVETISWESAQVFINKLNAYEAKAGKLPAGYHYALPKESQWDMINADANIADAATSRMNTLSSTQDTGYSAPNKYGIYDTLGNVWEWCLDEFDDKGNHSLRGGCWLSSAEHFASAGTRQAGGPKYADQFTGLRVVLVHD